MNFFRVWGGGRRCDGGSTLEFQDVLKIEGDPQAAVAQLRSRIQFHADIPYVFAGSIRQDMETIFTSPDWPFFKSAIPIHLAALTFEEFSPFLLDKFKLRGSPCFSGTLDECLCALPKHSR